MEFSEEQKDFLKKFINLDSSKRDKYNREEYNCHLNISKIVGAHILKWDPKSEYLQIYPPDCKFDAIFEWIYFFQFLEKERYLYFLDFPTPTEGSEKSTLTTYMTYFDKSKINQKGINEFYTKDSKQIDFDKGAKTINTKQVVILDDFFRKAMFSTSKLRELVARDFKTQEQIRFETEIQLTKGIFRGQMRVSTKMFKKQFCATLWAICISVVALLASVIISIIGICKNNDMKTDSQQHNELINAIKNTPADTTQIEIIKPIPLETSLKKEIDTAAVSKKLNGKNY